MSYQPDAKTSTCQHTTFTREKLPCSQRDPNPNPKQLALGRPHTGDFNRCDSRGSDLRRWRFFMRGLALERTVSSHKHWFGYVMDSKDMALGCAVLLRTRNVKKRKKFWVHPVTSQRLLKGKFYSLYEDLKAQTKLESVVQHLINCWFCLVQVLHFKIAEWERPCHQTKG
jgi:hypothetical protein